MSSKLVTSHTARAVSPLTDAVRLLRHARLTLCRRCRPSPCPTHYGGHLATMPSADFCHITTSVTAYRAARIAVGFDGYSSAFALARNSTPVTTPAACATDLPGIKNMNCNRHGWRKCRYCRSKYLSRHSRRICCTARMAGLRGQVPTRPCCSALYPISVRRLVALHSANLHYRQKD